MGFVQDFAPVFRRHPLQYVKSEKEIGDIVSFFFTCGCVHSWKAGQHGIVSFPRKMKGGSWRGFSIASSPGEELIRIATRIQREPSEFKKALLGLTPGDEVFMRGPFGPFYLSGSREPVVFIAGGIGITPYRALILHASANRHQAPASMDLIYSDDSGNYAFRGEFDELSAKSATLHTFYTTSVQLPEQLSGRVQNAAGNAIYYLSGPPKMVKSVQKTLKSLGVPKSRIRHELFMGL